jgi:cysteine desulfurase
MVTVNGLPSETQVMIMDINGIAVGSGPACSSGSVKPSRVLMAMGCPEEEAKCCMRISLGWCTTQDDISRFKDAWDDMIQKLRHKIIAA